MVNEALDPLLVIARLKQEIVDLKMEIRILRGDDADRIEPSEEQKEAFRTELQEYCCSTLSVLDLNRSIHLIRYGITINTAIQISSIWSLGFQVMKEFVQEAKNQSVTTKQEDRNNKTEENSKEDSFQNHAQKEESQKTRVQLSTPQKHELVITSSIIFKNSVY